MAEVQAQTLYEFEGDESNGELSFQSGETLTILQQDVGDGWWEARSYLGKTGLIPQAYVELIEPPMPSFPPPPPPMPSAPVAEDHNGWGGGGVEAQQSVDGWDDDWSDDGESSTSTGPGDLQGSYNPPAGQNMKPLQGSGNFGLSQGNSKRSSATASTSPPNDMSKYGTVKKSFNRFSQFAKAGGEAYMMGHFTNTNVSASDKIQIVDTADGVGWQPNNQPFTCAIRSPKKESKLKGLKSYIAYQLTPSFSNIQVSRRFKHFDWLHIQLENKYTCIPIPPLPDKTLSGRYEDEFIDGRMKLLQLWVDRICRHPVLSMSEVFQHFLTCTDEKKWKQGKRRSEKDEYTGGKFFLTLEAPQGVDLSDIDAKMEVFCKFQKLMEDNVKALLAVAYDNRKKHLGPFKREYQKLGGAFKTLAQTFTLDTGAYSQTLTGAIDYTGDTYNEIGDMFEKQPRNDLEPLMDVLNEYKGILGQFPDVLKVHEGAIGKAKECVKLQAESKMVESAVTNVVQRANIISCGTLAEINQFQKTRCVDFKDTMRTFLSGQIQFYSEITQKLQQALEKVESS
ncbi:sorting nexin lst-4-like [Mya arenaria]|uniref:sorting nexin lst-4-like n=1 Tax=Mya arenaria TaxID=6604 RepID=UPI0022E0A120|nr:sorting nexin lst-4-like [Mya arenaria]